MRPLDFEDARDQYGSLEFEEWLRRSAAHRRRVEEQVKENARKKYERHPRTRISRCLQSLSEKIALDKPEETDNG